MGGRLHADAEAALEFSRTHNEKYVEGMSRVQMGRILGRTDPAQAEKAEEDAGAEKGRGTLKGNSGCQY